MMFRKPSSKQCFDFLQTFGCIAAFPHLTVGGLVKAGGVLERNKTVAVICGHLEIEICKVSWETDHHPFQNVPTRRSETAAGLDTAEATASPDNCVAGGERAPGQAGRGGLYAGNAQREGIHQNVGETLVKTRGHRKTTSTRLLFLERPHKPQTFCQGKIKGKWCCGPSQY